jgi:hypothetical protein
VLAAFDPDGAPARLHGRGHGFERVQAGDLLDGVMAFIIADIESPLAQRGVAVDRYAAQARPDRG